MSKVRTRFAPSPTGYMHIGNLRTALYEYLIAKHDGGDFILRIEDTDQQREVAGAVDMIYDVLDKTGLHYDEGPDKPGDVGPYIQSQRLAIYKEYADKLVELGGAHYCFCDEETIEEAKKENADHEELGYIDPCKSLSLEEAKQRIANGEKYVVRQTIPSTGVTSFDDEVYGHIEVENAGLSEGVLLKSDGYPTYNFANIVDDHLMNITHVVRGNEYLSSTPKYNLIYQAFGWEPPVYIHCPPVMKDETHKLSKRNGDASYQDLISKGYLSEAILNYIALLGWSPKEEKELFTLDELIQSFSVDRISKSGAIFDNDKLKWMNSQYLKEKTLDELVDLCLPFLQKAYDLSDKSDEWIRQLIDVHRDHISYGEEIVEQVALFFEDDMQISEEAQEFMQDESIPNTLAVFRSHLEQLSDEEFDADHIFACIKATQKEAKAKGKMLYMPIRIATTGIMHGPDLTKSIALLGKTKVLSRLEG
ncbi:glutamate--tRNA ligase [Massilimicrobiota timonensis]|uniref:Glutamate--tRNA ligase n=1 Tax=Massilimicrobiota timonensis TaxID=1776392 RepID=A0ABT7UH52_9FIRM|nr:glutamate--tRNA ligase [Massilimicrobiota timonensis]MDM8195472.1 glutamate--tRNA ligase [Massilimicrobiota timonensis]